MHGELKRGNERKHYAQHLNERMNERRRRKRALAVHLVQRAKKRYDGGDTVWRDVRIFAAAENGLHCTIRCKWEWTGDFWAYKSVW